MCSFKNTSLHISPSLLKTWASPRAFEKSYFLESYLLLFSFECYLLIPLLLLLSGMLSVLILIKFANACMDPTCSNSEVQMQWNKKSYLRK